MSLVRMRPVALLLGVLAISPAAAEATPGRSERTMGSAYGGRAAPAEIIARERRPGFVAAYGGTVVWSSYDRRSRRYRLRARVGEGRIHTLPIASGRRPFGLDLGPGPDGGLAAVYPRCPGDFRPAPGGRRAPQGRPDCDVFEYDFGRRRERRRGELSRRGYDEFAPTIWRGRVAFARTRPTNDATFRPTRLFVSTDGGRPQPLRGGSKGARDDAVDLGYAEPTGLDLRGRRLAFSWTLRAKQGTCLEDPKMGRSTADELWLVELGGRRRRVAAGCEYDDALGFGDPTLTADGLFATMTRRFYDRSIEDQLVDRLSRFSFRGTPMGEVDSPTSGPETGLVAATQDGSDTYFLMREATGRYTVRRQRFFG